MDQADDLKAFERRMIEIISSLQPSIWRWRLILIILFLITCITFISLIVNLSFSFSSSSSLSSSPLTTLFLSSSTKSNDINNMKSYLKQFLSNFFRREIYFSLSFGLLIFVFLFGIHRKMFASSIIITRLRCVLADYNMSCDFDGRLIIKPRPTTYAGS